MGGYCRQARRIVVTEQLESGRDLGRSPDENIEIGLV